LGEKLVIFIDFNKKYPSDLRPWDDRNNLISSFLGVSEESHTFIEFLTQCINYIFV